jgi:hypothetical protein
MASFFSPTDLSMHRCDKDTGKVVGPKFLFDGLGDLPAMADLESRHRAVAQMVTRPKNPRFARTMVNRLWKRLLGRGLFEPVDNFDGNPPNADLLDWLAHDFMSHDYDAKQTLRQILLSKVYQAPVDRAKAKGKEAPPLVGPVERRLTGEQYLDAVAQVTGFWRKEEVMKVDVPNPQVRTWRQRKPDALVTALGRPNREQVCTERNQESTVLQALELVNGTVLAGRLKEGAKTLLASELGRQEDTAKVVRTLYLRALSREPSAEETALASPLLATKAASRQEAWEDVLWVLFMSPDFQFVR